MSMTPSGEGWQRRARPLLGTLVEIGLSARDDPAALEAAFAAIVQVQASMSRFEADSDVCRFHALAVGEAVTVDPGTREVLQAARSLHEATAGVFDITLGTGPEGWRCQGLRLEKLAPAVRLDLGGIAKGHAVDQAVDALLQRGCSAGWVNAGGDLRVFGEARVPVMLRDEQGGGVRPFVWLDEGALASSHLGPDSRCQAWTPLPAGPVHAHVTVAAPRCLWADALTKVVAVTGDARHPLLAVHGGQAWLH